VVRVDLETYGDALVEKEREDTGTFTSEGVEDDVTFLSEVEDKPLPNLNGFEERVRSVLLIFSKEEVVYDGFREGVVSLP
jgi:hypothetical protein